MEPFFHHDYRQQPITSDEAREQYRHYLAQIEAFITDQEEVVRQARDSADVATLAQARTSLWRLLTKRQGVLDQLAVYEGQHIGLQ